MSSSPASTAVRSTLSHDAWLALARRARFLSWLSLGVIGLEAGVAIWAGIVASSAALLGFGVDSIIEGAASLIIVWRFTGSRLLSHTSESAAQRLVALQFFALAPYVAYQALHDLIQDAAPSVSWVGIALAIMSLITMPLLGRAKQRIGREMGSKATHGEGAQNILCAYMAAALLVGLVGNALFGIWQLDPIAALAISAIAIREGINTWRGEGCCAPAVEHLQDGPPIACAHDHAH